MKHFLVIVLALFAVLLAAPAASSAPADFAVDWFTLGSGGESSGGGFALEGIIGQVAAGVMSGGGYEIQGGFPSGTDVAKRLHLPAVRAGQ